jgi:hypothetical protein
MAKTLSTRIYNFHGFVLKLGPRLGGPFVKFAAYFALYKIFTSGGLEALAFIAYEHMIREGEKEKQKANGNRQSKTQS